MPTWRGISNTSRSNGGSLPARWRSTAKRWRDCRASPPPRPCPCARPGCITSAGGRRSCTLAAWRRAASRSRSRPGAAFIAGSRATGSSLPIRSTACARRVRPSLCRRRCRWITRSRLSSIATWPPSRRWRRAMPASPSSSMAAACVSASSSAWTWWRARFLPAGSTPPMPAPMSSARAASGAACRWAAPPWCRSRPGWRCAARWRARAKLRFSSAAAARA